MGYYCIFYSFRINFYICVKGRNFLRMFGGVKGGVRFALIAHYKWKGFICILPRAAGQYTDKYRVFI